MSPDEIRNAIKTGTVVVFGVLMLLSAFGPLAQYREWFLLAAGVVSIVASAVFGVELKKPTEQARMISARRAGLMSNATEQQIKRGG